MKSKQFFILTSLLAFTIACGKGILDIDNRFYSPKIVIQGTLQPQHKAQVRLTRNFAINAFVDSAKIILKDANAVIRDESGGSFELTFNEETLYYESDELVVDYGKTYSLEVKATIDGKELFAKSTTKVPQAGFKILEEKSRLGSMGYRQRDGNGDLINFDIVFDRSPSTDFYVVSINALDADTTTFIYDNPFGEVDTADVIEDFKEFKYTYDWIQDTPLTSGESRIDIFSFFTWFYGDYRAILYAGDKNFKDFFVTHGEVKEIDGNFHEPAFHIDGDGIGVFSSAIADTVFFAVLRNN